MSLVINRLSVGRVLLLILAIFSSLLILNSFSIDVSAQVDQNAKDAACGSIGGGCDGSAKSGVDSLLRTSIDILSWIVGVISVIMVIVGGLRFILAGGDANGVSSAKKTVAYALVGLAVAAVAQILTKFVISRVK
ncbi:hypothetical protein KC867_01875 [Candidatus Saccharibacteria bacterium]|nr:hypothetical protein [Candidatus Saccharibacteria bacterium]